ncbi:NAD-dependent epimerase/dehydratase family protein [Microbacterium indicum]|uniref:NAD-dependent epimerase/dehydratase family protein n=1 Tax=Microbacterium indicum TaxID=358100 RepID=UPI0004174375|nr:NAD-dependent epimerase/dehydratase family protein [Microbacterium indicum]
MRILILGGTAFLGRQVAVEAAARGHDVTCLARGTRPAPEGIDLVVADRDDDRGLEPVAAGSWDAVVDVTSQPGQARRAVRDLDGAHWVFVSSGNVYADFVDLEQDERSTVRTAFAGDALDDMEAYGEAKVACEAAFRAAAGSATIVRPGLIGGPGDETGRSGYWPLRFAHPTGDDVIAPDDPDFPCAMIDVRDLAAWIVLAAEQHLDGVFNATGPTTALRDVLAASAEVAGSSTPARLVSGAQLAALGIGSWMGPASLPLWIDDPGWRGFATLDTTRARANGLTTRPLRETLRDALAFEESRGGPRRAGLDDADERRVRAALELRG